MKPRNNCFLFLTGACATAIVSSITYAADLDWEGDVSSDFLVGTNWEGNNLPNFATDILRFKNNSAPTTVTNVNVTFSNSGTGAGTTLSQILFDGSAPAYTLGSSSNTITLGSAATNTYNNAIVLSSSSTVTQTIASKIVIDDGKAYTASVVNSSVTGGLLKLTGNISGGTGAGTPGIIAFNFGNTSTHNGNYEVTGNITAGGASAITLTKRGSGILTLSGNNTLGATNAGLGQNEAGSTIRINGGTTTLNNGSANHWGGNNLVGLSPVVQISAGILDAQSARNIRSSLLIDGGTLNIAESRLSFDAANGNKTFTMTSGAVNVNATTGSFGVRFGGDSGVAVVGYGFTGIQSGGDFTVKGAGGQETTFQLGSTTESVATTYALSSGKLDIQGSDSTNGHLTLGADAAGTSSTTFTLSGDAKLLVRSGTAGLGINGKTTDAIQNFDFTGGTLAAGEITTANLRATGDLANGTFTNQGGVLAPGDIGFSGKTTVTGNMKITSGTLSFDIGATTDTASTAWQDALNSGKNDQLAVTGDLQLGGNLVIDLIDSVSPNPLTAYKLIDLTGAGTLSNFFDNVIDGGTLMTAGNQGTFTVFKSGNDIWINNFTAVPEPTSALAGLLIAAGLLRRRRSA